MFGSVYRNKDNSDNCTCLLALKKSLSLAWSLLFILTFLRVSFSWVVSGYYLMEMIQGIPRVFNTPGNLVRILLLSPYTFLMFYGFS